MAGKSEHSFLELVVKNMEADILEDDVSVDGVVEVPMVNLVVRGFLIKEEGDPFGVSILNPESDEGGLMRLGEVYISGIKLFFEHTNYY